MRLALATVLLVASAAAARAQSFQARLTSALLLLEDTVASFGRAVPFPSACTNATLDECATQRSVRRGAKDRRRRPLAPALR